MDTDALLSTADFVSDGRQLDGDIGSLGAGQDGPHGHVGRRAHVDVALVVGGIHGVSAGVAATTRGGRGGVEWLRGRRGIVLRGQGRQSMRRRASALEVCRG
jgi:hypothetical protein